MVAVVTGGSSGIGRETAAMLSKKGYKVYELSRSGKNEAYSDHISADVSVEADVTAAFETVFSREGRLDLLINNAGMGISGAVEFTDANAAHRLFDVNFFGQFYCIKAAIPLMRKSGGGRIISLSSVAAPIAIPFQAFYSASKAAVNSLTLALRSELTPFGIHVSAVMPGDVRTGFTAAREKADFGDDLYGGVIDRAVSAMERDETDGMSPGAVAGTIYKIASSKHPRPLYTVGSKYRLFVLIAKLIPCSFSNYLVRKIYC